MGTDQPLADLLRRLMMQARGLRRSLGQALNARLTPLLEGTVQSPAVVAAARDVLRGYTPDLANLIADSTAAAWVRGAGDVAGILPEELPLPRLPDWWKEPGRLDDWGWRGRRVFAPVVREATQDLRSRQLVLRPEYDRLSDEAKQRAFTVAGVQSERALGRVRDVLAEAAEEGLSWRDTRRRVRDEALDDVLSETVFRANVSRAYSAGMDRVLGVPVVDEMFPFEETIVTPDSRLSELCETVGRSGLQGTAVFRRADPVYRHFCSPRHWGCRCSRRPLSIADAARRGIVAAQRWLQTGREPVEDLFVPWPDIELPKGWLPPGEGGGVLRMSLEVCHVA